MNATHNSTWTLSVNETYTTVNQTEDMENNTHQTDFTTQFTMTTRDSFMNYAPYRWTIAMIPIYQPILFTIGMLGNTLSLCVVLRKTMRKVSSCVFVSVLAVSDNMTLIGFLLGLLSQQIPEHVLSHPYCKVFITMVGVGTMLSSYTVVLMTLERLLIVTFPLKAPNWITQKKVMIAEGILIVYSLLHNCHFFITVIHFEPAGYCDYNYAKYIKFFKVYSVFDIVMATYIPLILVFFLNISIIVQLGRAKSTQKKMSSDTQKATSSTDQITIMLLTVSLAFFVCTAPYGVLQVFLFHVWFVPGMSKGSQSIIHFIRECFVMLWMMNHSINIFLYSLTGRKFRNEARHMLMCTKGTSQPMSVQSTTAISTVASSVEKPKKNEELYK